MKGSRKQAQEKLLKQNETYTAELKKRTLELFLDKERSKFVIFGLDKRQWQGMGDRGIGDHDWYANVNRE